MAFRSRPWWLLPTIFPCVLWACQCSEVTTGSADKGLLLADVRVDGPVVDGRGLERQGDDRREGADHLSFDLLVADTTHPDASVVDREQADAVVDGSGMERVVPDVVGYDLATVNDASPAPDAVWIDTSPVDSPSVDVKRDAGWADGRRVDGAQQVMDRPEPKDAGETTSCLGQGLCIVLTWQSAGGDLDLHLSRNGADYCTDQSCYWANCRQAAATRVEWDGTAGVSAGDPLVSGDNLTGYGPETLAVVAPVVGAYTLGVYYNPPSSLPATVATVIIYSGQNEVGSLQRTVSANSFWEIGDIVIQPTSIVLTESPRICPQGDWICTDGVHTCPE